MWQTDDIILPGHGQTKIRPHCKYIQTASTFDPIIILLTRTLHVLYKDNNYRVEFWRHFSCFSTIIDSSSIIARCIFRCCGTFLKPQYPENIQIHRHCYIFNDQRRNTVAFNAQRQIIPLLGRCIYNIFIITLINNDARQNEKHTGNIIGPGPFKHRF